MKKRNLLVLIPLLLASACSAVNSSELKTTTADGTRLVATVDEYKNSDSVRVNAQMQTLESQVGIEFNQGETLTAASDTENGISESVSLSDNYFLNLDHSYEGSVNKTKISGNYYITYKDKDDIETTAKFATGTVADIISPANGSTLSGDTVTVTWDPNGMSASVSVVITWSGGSSSGYSSKNCDNTGSCEIDITHMHGTGKLKLYNTKEYTSMDGFGATSIKMNNIVQEEISLANPDVSATKSLTAKEEIVDEIMNKCLKFCEDGEKVMFTVDKEEYSCCIGE